VSVLNEAVFYMSYLPKDTIKIIAIKKSTHSRRKETLAEYYLRTYNHLLKGIKIFEIDCDLKKINIVKE